MIEHPSASQVQLEESIAAGFASGVIPSLAHYRTSRQATAWHNVATSFFDRAPGRSAFEEVYAEVATACVDTPVHVIALGCGDGAKEESLVRVLRDSAIDVSVTLADISPSLLRIAAARQATCGGANVPSLVVCDVTTIGADLALLIEQQPGRRVVTMFGVLPGLTSPSAFDAITPLLRDGDLFTYSGNMLPDGDGQIERLCEFYATGPAHDWMALIFSDSGIDDGALRWFVEPAYTPQVHAVATVSVKVEVLRDCSAQIGDEVIDLHEGQIIDTFRSHRHSAASLRALVEGLGLTWLTTHLSASAEEGVVLARR